MRYVSLSLLFLLFFYSSCQTINSNKYITTNGEFLESRLDSILTNVVNVYQIPGFAVGIVKDNKIVYAKGFGLKKLGTLDSISTTSVFHMASVSKPFVATAILQLVGKGKIALDSPLTKYIPYFKMKDPRYKGINVKQMLTHTSGFPDVKDYGWDKPQYEDDALERYIKDSVSTYELMFDPGTQFSYSNMAYDVLAEVIKQASGIPFETYENKNILKLCKMNNSTFKKKDVLPVLATSPHIFGKNCEFELSNLYPYNRCHAGSSTLHSNIEDMLKWESMIINNGKFDSEEILSPEIIKMMLSPQYKFDENSSDGLGLFIDKWNGKKLISHSGGDVGYTSYIGMIPEDSIGIAFMSNLHRFVPYEIVANVLLNALYNFPEPLIKKPIALVIAPIICKEDFAKARKKYYELKNDSASKYDFDEHWLNTLGLAFKQLGNLNTAIDVLRLNLDNYPNSTYCYECLGDTYILNKQNDKAAESYKNALKFDPHCSGCLSKLKKLERQ